ncbi:MAG: DUF3347 domain-containing protein, partial [Nitrospiraceae bacterium]|nr:DUF3347 domain-containing protein [Nitrospiraceae bacterium]
DKSGKADSIESAREALAPLSEALWSAAKAFGIKSDQAVYQAHCPMAFDGQGAKWLQADTTVRNPYFGASMLSCGSIVGKLTPSVEGSRDNGSHAEGSDHK